MNWGITIIIKMSTCGTVEVEIEGLNNIQQSPPSTSAWHTGSTNMPDAHVTLHKYLLKKDDFDDVLRELKEFQGD